jgi:protein SCO1
MTTHTRRQFLAFGGGLLGATVLAGCAGKASVPIALASSGMTDSEEVRAERRRRRFVDNALVTHEGKEVSFYNDLLKDKAVLINFMYVMCKDEGFCPMMTYNLSKVQTMLGDRLGKEVFMYSITLDPDNDTPELLSSYASHFKPKPGGWQFLTGTKQDIADVRKSLGFSWVDPTRDKIKQEHIGVVKYGIEPLERWGACPALSKPEAIVAYLDWMTPNSRRPFG